MNEQRQALLDALGAARLPDGTIAWPAVLLALAGCVLLGLTIGLLVRRARRSRRMRQAELAWRDEARDTLARLGRVLDAQGVGAQGEADDRAPAQAEHAWVTDAALLARRVALVIDARERIAALSGTAWLQHLDGLLGQRVFQVEPVAALARIPYRPATVVPIRTRRAIHAALAVLIDAAERRCEAASAQNEPAPARLVDTDPRA